MTMGKGEDTFAKIASSSTAHLIMRRHRLEEQRTADREQREYLASKIRRDSAAIRDITRELRSRNEVSQTSP